MVINKCAGFSTSSHLLLQWLVSPKGNKDVRASEPAGLLSFMVYVTISPTWNFHLNFKFTIIPMGKKIEAGFKRQFIISSVYEKWYNLIEEDV